MASPVLAASGPEGLVERVQALTAELDTIDDPHARQSVHELIGAILELYGEGLERIFQALADPAATGPEIRERLTADGVVASLLLIHGLYPIGLETRVTHALDKVRPYMETHGGYVELLSLEGGVARLRLQGSCHGCSSAAVTMELAIKRALEEAAPDLLGIEVEGVEPAVAEHAPAQSSNGSPGPRDLTWLDCNGLVQLS